MWPRPCKQLANRTRLLVGILLLGPLLLAVGWGAYLPDSAYLSLHAAQSLAQGQPPPALSATWTLSPLWLAVLLLTAAMGLPLTTAALLLNTVGWGATAVFCHHLLRQQSYHPLVAVTTAILLIVSPPVTATWGTPAPWLALAAGLALYTTTTHRWQGQIASLLVLLALFPEWPALLLVLALLVWRARIGNKLPRRPLLLALLSLTMALGTRWALSAPLFSPLQAPPIAPAQLFAQSEFYIFFVPLVGLGLWAVLGQIERHTTLLGLLLWGAMTMFTGEVAAFTVAVLLVTGIGVDTLATWVRERQWLQGPEVKAETAVALLLALPLLVAHGQTLWQQYWARPTAYRQLETEAAQWLDHNTPPDATVLGSARLGYLAQRATLPWSGDVPLWQLLRTIVPQPPPYVATAQTPYWQALKWTNWFNERYRPLQTFQDQYTTYSPLTIWHYQRGPFDAGTAHSIDVETSQGIDLIAYRYWPEQLQPGQAVHVTLDWQVTRPITTNVNTIVHLASPVSQEDWARRDLRTPRSLPPQLLPPGSLFSERFVLTTTQTIPVGAYELSFSLDERSQPGLVPLYQNGDPNVLDRVSLGYVVVPWPGNIETAVSVGATFDQQIQLLGYELAGLPQPGTTITTTLYWQALQPPDDNYTVFTHLLDDNGQWVAGHDAQPRNGTYPTRAFQPEHIIPDAHPLTLPPDLPPGRYHLAVGLYNLETGLRLPAIASDGRPQPDNAIKLKPIELD